MTEVPEDEADPPADNEKDVGEKLFEALMSVCDGFSLDVVANEAANLLAYAIVQGSPTHEEAKAIVLACNHNLVQFVAMNMRGKPKKRLIISRLQ